MKKLLTLCVVYQEPKVLLGMKKRGFGEGKWNGFGGKVTGTESIEEAARREAWEEAGIELADLTKAGIIEFEFEGDPTILEVHVFRSEKFSGEPAESEEMKPQWFHVNDIPFKNMWPDDVHWMPLCLAGKKFRGKFTFDSTNTIIHHELSEVHTV